jgi:hypothetical protein
MSAFEKQLTSITTKAELKKWVDELHEDAVALIIVQEPTEEGEGTGSYSWGHYGSLSNGDTLWLVEKFKMYLLEDPAEEDAEEEYE